MLGPVNPEKEDNYEVGHLVANWAKIKTKTNEQNNKKHRA